MKLSRSVRPILQARHSISSQSRNISCIGINITNPVIPTIRHEDPEFTARLLKRNRRNSSPNVPIQEKQNKQKCTVLHSATDRTGPEKTMSCPGGCFRTVVVKATAIIDLSHYYSISFLLTSLRRAEWGFRILISFLFTLSSLLTSQKRISYGSESGLNVSLMCYSILSCKCWLNDCGHVPFSTRLQLGRAH